jgi:hypothetical protein
MFVISLRKLGHFLINEVKALHKMKALLISFMKALGRMKSWLEEEMSTPNLPITFK